MMTKLTLAIDVKLLQAARIKALQEGTTVNEICRNAIARYAQPAGDGNAFMVKWLAVEKHIGPSCDGKPLWPGREALYEAVLAPCTRGEYPQLSDAGLTEPAAAIGRKLK